MDNAEYTPTLCRIIQIGDVHYPDHNDASSTIDNKDPALTGAFSKAVGTSPFQQSLRTLLRVLEARNFCAVSFMGDLTSYGEIDGFEECVKLFAKSFRLSSVDDALIKPAQIMVVAGNHDINRDEAVSKGSPAKFKPLNEILEKHNFLPFNIDSIDKRNVPKTDGPIMLLGINSCLGCGETRHIAEALTSKIKDKELAAKFLQKLNEVVDEIDTETDKPVHLFEVLDAPIVHSDVVTELSDVLNNESKSKVIVMSAHHNLLPQQIPRLAPYTELVNSGAIRRTITSSGRPVIYLHGHIHTSDMERITDPSKPNGEAICISAPAFVDGFNIIEIAFEKDGRPLGCRVLPYRASGVGALIKEQELIIPFGGLPRSVMSPQQLEILSFIRKRHSCYIRDLIEEVSNDCFDGADRNLLIRRTVEELYWGGLIRKESVGTSETEQRITSVTNIL